MMQEMTAVFVERQAGGSELAEVEGLLQPEDAIASADLDRVGCGSATAYAADSSSSSSSSC
jgi:hypothetical protein